MLVYKNLIGARLACASNRLLAIDCSIPVTLRAAVHWTLPSLFRKFTEPMAPLLEMV